MSENPVAAASAQAKSSRLGAAVAWGLWGVMLLIALCLVWRYGGNVPINDETTMVPYFTGEKPVTIEWLWSRHNEHRIVLPRLVYLGTMKLSGGDYRGGMCLNVMLLGAIAALMMLAMRRLRGSTSWVDGFFPLLWLSLAHWQNMLWSFQIAFVLPSFLMTCVLCGMMGTREPPSAFRSLLFGLCLTGMALCGANGLVMVPALALWPLYLGVLGWKSPEPNARARAVAAFSVAIIPCAVAALCLRGPGLGSSAETHPSVVTTATGAMAFLGTGIGRMPGAFRTVAGVGVCLFLLTTAIVLFRAWRRQAADRMRLSGLLFAMFAVAMLAAAIGFGRGGKEGSDPAAKFRYATLAAPALAAAFFAWHICWPGALGRRVLIAMFAVMSLVLPYNSYMGMRQAQAIKAEESALITDIRAGLPPEEVAARHWRFFCYAEGPYSEALSSLSRAHMGPYRECPPK